MSQLLEALRTRSPLPTKAVAHHATDTGCCQVELGDDLTVLAYYEACMVGADEHIEVTEISISGHTVPAYMLATDVLEAWAVEIAAERADDLRSSREAAEYAAWEAAQ
jgi:hypothetical protein